MKKNAYRILCTFFAAISIFIYSPLVKATESDNQNPKQVCPGGMPFGIQIMTDGLLVVGFSQIDSSDGTKTSPAYDAGIREKDVIININGHEADSSEIFLNEIENCNGNPVEISYKRNGKEFKSSITPILSSSENKYKIGMWLRDSTAGIGTITFFDPNSGSFAGLGHGISDSETGELLPIRRGTAVDVKINGITKGMAGTPGELLGYFSSGKTGTLVGNTSSGVYGAFAQLPEAMRNTDTMEAGSSEIHDGDAFIMSTLDDNTIGKYTVNLSDISKNGESKNFVVTVTDEKLLEKTGGIVQGMSGSPVIQDGKIVGAVTHVLISDPTKGFGIFIENMFENMPEILK